MSIDKPLELWTVLDDPGPKSTDLSQSVKPLIVSGFVAFLARYRSVNQLYRDSRF